MKYYLLTDVSNTEEKMRDRMLAFPQDEPIEVVQAWVNHFAKEYAKRKDHIATKYEYVVGCYLRRCEFGIYDPVPEEIEGTVEYY